MIGRPGAARPKDTSALGSSIKQSEVAYQRLKEAILDGRIELGATITQGEIAEMLGVQISGLRVAINKLETEGLVKVFARYGIKIVKPDLMMIRDSFQLRSLIELEGIRAYIRRAPEAAVRELRDRHVTMLEQLEQNDESRELLDAMTQLDVDTHAAFVRALENPLIDAVILNNQERLALIRRQRDQHRTRMLAIETIHEHLAFMVPAEQRDVESAVRALDQHLSASMKRAMGL